MKAMDGVAARCKIAVPMVMMESGLPTSPVLSKEEHTQNTPKGHQPQPQSSRMGFRLVRFAAAALAVGLVGAIAAHIQTPAEAVALQAPVSLPAAEAIVAANAAPVSPYEFSELTTFDGVRSVVDSSSVLLKDDAWADALSFTERWLKAAKAEQARQATIQKRVALLGDRIGSDYRIAPEAARFVAQEAHRVGDKARVDPILLLAIVGIESRFNPYAGSTAGALGLTQTMPSAHPEKIKAINDSGQAPLDPQANLEMGASILREYLNRFDGNRELALQQYNGSLKDGSRNYSRAVLKVYHRFGAGLPPLPSSVSFPSWPAMAKAEPNRSSSRFALASR